MRPAGLMCPADACRRGGVLAYRVCIRACACVGGGTALRLEWRRQPPRGKSAAPGRRQAACQPASADGGGCGGPHPFKRAVCWRSRGSCRWACRRTCRRAWAPASAASPSSPPAWVGRGEARCTSASATAVSQCIHLHNTIAVHQQQCETHLGGEHDAGDGAGVGQAAAHHLGRVQHARLRLVGERSGDGELERGN